jgi:hypothetical protein
MQLKTTSGTTADINVEEILRAAGVIYSSRRKVHAGPPKRTYCCGWCAAQCQGRAALLEHERACDQRPTGEFTEADLARMAWTPPDAA